MAAWGESNGNWKGGAYSKLPVNENWMLNGPEAQHDKLVDLLRRMRSSEKLSEAETSWLERIINEVRPTWLASALKKAGFSG